MASAIDAMLRLLPGLRAAFEAFVPPKDAPPNPPMEAARTLLTDAEALFARVRDGEEIGHDDPAVLAVAIRRRDVLTTWSMKMSWNYAEQNRDGTQGPLRVWMNVAVFAECVFDLWRACREIRDARDPGMFAKVWERIGYMTLDRIDLPVSVLGNPREYSEGVRRRAEEALAKMGAVGVWTLDESSGIRSIGFVQFTDFFYKPDHFERQGKRVPAPRGLYADVVVAVDNDKDLGKFKRPVLPDELDPHQPVLPDERRHDEKRPALLKKRKREGKWKGKR